MRPLCRSTLVLALVVATASAAPAHAQQRPDELDVSYLWDGGAVPLFWAPVLGASLLAWQVDASDQPRFFSATEGGKASRIDRELPGYYVTAGAAALGVGLIADSDPSRWFHLKGMLQSVAVTSFVTVSTKLMVGRRRPDFDPDARYHGDNWSFPSGHTSQAVTALTYTALYLRFHGFDRWRPPGELRWWEGATYAALVGMGAAVGAERVHNHRHHLSDVLVGTAFGATSAAAMFAFQEWRYRRAARGDGEDSLPPIMVTPMVDRPGVELGLRF